MQPMWQQGHQRPALRVITLVILNTTLTSGGQINAGYPKVQKNINSKVFQIAPHLAVCV
jgi:hypothetical protein